MPISEGWRNSPGKMPKFVVHCFWKRLWPWSLWQVYLPRRRLLVLMKNHHLSTAMFKPRTALCRNTSSYAGVVQLEFRTVAVGHEFWYGSRFNAHHNLKMMVPKKFWSKRGDVAPQMDVPRPKGWWSRMTFRVFSPSFGVPFCGICLKNTWGFPEITPIHPSNWMEKWM